MLRRNTTHIFNNSKRVPHRVLRSRKSVPQYSDSINLGLGNEYQQEEARFGNFSVLNENTHPGVVYYFIELRNSGDDSSTPGRGNNNNNNNNEGDRSRGSDAHI
ncbi:Roq1p KNAG_0C02580 [Huiozyma naganishii CBS 8797]|uniref:Uncharacterized protein n=1 Tax=Huiozyma naganishii (strain ATCC MYA-139 / BCRC 22969 / CBS 8797 / KCTC 17520 / NBRC 10181 / NCYC 3082 / Yp74L-3) TaxID=1071383 RepID=J7S4M4_HUIN7|nr:hypothetical protein KNAG_0C02580 [Kazachstania naganishii CBS 8797]CCK69369.1 hypothetical protein KNAG_0C02580 [Kazachstania naganishii CBS 8797]